MLIDLIHLEKNRKPFFNAVLQFFVFTFHGNLLTAFLMHELIERIV